jgi:hypothetical protein
MSTEEFKAILEEISARLDRMEGAEASFRSNGGNETTLESVASRLEGLSGKVSAIVRSLEEAGIGVQDSRAELADGAKLDEAKMSEAARRNE